MSLTDGLVHVYNFNTPQKMTNPWLFLGICFLIWLFWDLENGREVKKGGRK